MGKIVASSFGPFGLSKLVINSLDKLIVTSNAGAVLKELEIEHPAAKLILYAAEQQDSEYGDGTNTVIILTSELLSLSESLIKMGVRPSVISQGFDKAAEKAMEILSNLSKPLSNLRNAIESVVGSKLAGKEGFLTDMILEAVNIVTKDNVSFNPENIQPVKLIGGSLGQSKCIAGMVLTREAETFLKEASNAKVVVFSCGINSGRTETKGTVLLHNAKELLSYSTEEEKILENQIKEISETGVKVVVCGDAISELALHFLNRYNLVGIRVPSKFDLKRVCKAVGTIPLSRLGAPSMEEIGWCDMVQVEEIGGDRCTIFRQSKSTKDICLQATILIRASNSNFMDDIQRIIEDALATIKTLKREPKILMGAGAIEIEIARQLGQHADITPGVLQLPIRKYAEAFEAIPRLLATNSGLDGTEAISRLYWSHEKGNTDCGLYLEAEDIEQATTPTDEIVIDAFATKKSAIILATEVATTILKIDHIIMSKQSNSNIKPKQMGPTDSADD